MQTIESIRRIVDQCSHLDWEFDVSMRGTDCILQVKFFDHVGPWNGRKWLISMFATESEIVQTALKAVLTAVEHEAREAFTYKGHAIFGPHHDVNALVGIAQQKRDQVLNKEAQREEAKLDRS